MWKNVLLMILGIALGVFISGSVAVEMKYSIYVFMLIVACVRILLYILRNEDRDDFSILNTLLISAISIALCFIVTYVSMYFGMPFYMVLVVGYGYYIFRDLHGIIIFKIFKKNV